MFLSRSETFRFIIEKMLIFKLRHLYPEWNNLMLFILLGLQLYLFSTRHWKPDSIFALLSRARYRCIGLYE